MNNTPHKYPRTLKPTDPLYTKYTTKHQKHPQKHPQNHPQNHPQKHRRHTNTKNNPTIPQILQLATTDPDLTPQQLLTIKHTLAQKQNRENRKGGK